MLEAEIQLVKGGADSLPATRWRRFPSVWSLMRCRFRASRWPKLCVLLGSLLVGATYSTGAGALEVLVFSKVAEGAYRHSSIPAGIAALHEIGAAKGWQVDDTIDNGLFTAANLARYDVVVWNNTGGDVLDVSQRAAFEGFIRHGGGYVGIHEAAAGAGSRVAVNWPWYEKLVGAYFKQHPAGTPTARIVVSSTRHPSTRGLPNPWTRTDEWYEWIENPTSKDGLQILLYVDEKSYNNGLGRHPIAWCHEFEGGRSFYTAMGHTEASYSEAQFRAHLAGGIEWAAAHSPNLTSTSGKKR